MALVHVVSARLERDVPMRERRTSGPCIRASRRLAAGEGATHDDDSPALGAIRGAGASDGDSLPHHSGRTASTPCASKPRATMPRWISEVPS